MAKSTKKTVKSETVTPETVKIAIIGKNEALQLVRGLEDSRSKWVGFDRYITSLADRKSGITKQSVIQGLILEADKVTVKDYGKDTVNAFIKNFL